MSSRDAKAMTNLHGYSAGGCGDELVGYGFGDKRGLGMGL